MRDLPKQAHNAYETLQLNLGQVVAGVHPSSGPSGAAAVAEGIETATGVDNKESSLVQDLLGYDTISDYPYSRAAAAALGGVVVLSVAKSAYKKFRGKDESDAEGLLNPEGRSADQAARKYHKRRSRFEAAGAWFIAAGATLAVGAWESDPKSEESVYSPAELNIVIPGGPSALAVDAEGMEGQDLTRVDAAIQAAQQYVKENPNTAVSGAIVGENDTVPFTASGEDGELEGLAGISTDSTVFEAEPTNEDLISAAQAIGGPVIILASDLSGIGTRQSYRDDVATKNPEDYRVLVFGSPNSLVVRPDGEDQPAVFEPNLDAPIPGFATEVTNKATNIHSDFTELDKSEVLTVEYDAPLKNTLLTGAAGSAVFGSLLLSAFLIYDKSKRAAKYPFKKTAAAFRGLKKYRRNKSERLALGESGVAAVQPRAQSPEDGAANSHARTNSAVGAEAPKATGTAEATVNTATEAEEILDL